MEKTYPIISVSGTPGSGKSTVAENLAKALGAPRIYVGGLRRKLAKKMGLNLMELNEYALEHPETDVDIDKQAAIQARELAKKSLVIIEGRTQFYFLPESIKIYIKVSVAEGARRIWLSLQKKNVQQERNETSVSSLSALIKEIGDRQKNDLIRYQKYYHLDHTDESQYDFVLDTGDISADQATEKILKFLKNSKKFTL